MTTPSERHADLIASDGADPALDRLLGRLERTLAPRPVPQWLTANLDRSLRERIADSSRPLPMAAGAPALSRRHALKAGAASMTWLFGMAHGGPAMLAELAQLAGSEPMSGPRLAEILRTERARWNALLAQVGVERMDEPGVEGDWSVKQLIAHLTWYEQGIVEGARQVLRGGAFTRRRPEGMGLDAMNAQIAAESLARPAGEVLAEADRVFAELLALITASPQELLNDPRPLGLPEDVVPWMGVANNSYAHYREHEAALRAWLAR